MAEQSGPEDTKADWYKLDELIWSCAISQAVHVAVEIRAPELLEAGSKTASEIAETTSSDVSTLDCVLRALAAFDVLQLDAQERFSLTRMGSLLFKTRPGLPEEAGVFFETIYRPLGALIHAVKTGETAFDHAFGISFREYLSRNPAVRAFFDEQMIRNAPSRYGGISFVYDFSTISKVVDVGGGQGGLLLHLLRQEPYLKAVLFDLPEVVAGARDRIDRAGLSDRCDIVAGNFLESVPGGGDLYFLAAVVNNCNDRDAGRLLANCRSALGANGRVLIIENVRRTGPPVSRWAALVELGIMAQRGGRSRTEAQHRSLLASAGLQRIEIHRHRSSPNTVIEAISA